MNSSLKYLSFNSPNASRIKNPLAESTVIGSPLGQQEMSRDRGNHKRRTVSPLANASKHRQSSSVQIEPHVLTNAQSPGIVKRLVTYYNDSQGEPESNKYVYNRVGDFPIVHLKKTEIKHNLVRSSSVRIAPPSKTVFNRDIRAAIMRSNSMQLGNSVPKIQPTKMRPRDDAHQIITNHDPLPIDESAQSAKSVLDALEKNCRKRINNEELTMDRTKRICATEAVDGPNTKEFLPIVTQSAKRGRDQTSPSHKSESPNSQLRKKLRTKNNALFSSLSSSNYMLRPYNTIPSSSPSHQAPVKFTETSRTIDEVERAEKRLRETSVSVVEVEKPKAPQEKRLYLFNTRTEKLPTIFRSRVTSDDDDDEEFKVNFVKPRAKPLNYEESDEIQNFEKEKLSVMLSGLSDGYKSLGQDGVKDSVDSAILPALAPASISFTTSTTSSAASPITTPASSVLSLPVISGTTSTSSLLVSQVKVSEPSTVPTSTPSTDAVKTTIGIQFGVSAPVTSSLSSISVTSVAPSSTVSSTGRVSPLAIFTTPGAEKPATMPLIDPNKSLITFTPVGKPAITSSVPAVVSTVTTSAVPSFGAPSIPGGFSFGSTNKEAPKTTSGFSFGGTSTSSIGFGASSALPVLPSIPAVSTATSSTVTTAPPSFGLQSTSTPSFNFGAKPTAVSTAPSGISGISSLSSNSGNLTSTVSFMQKPATTIASGVGFSFGGSAAPSVNPLAPTTTASSGFSFGSSQNGSGLAAPVATTTSSFSFGAPSNPAFGTSAATSAFGQPAVTSPPSFGQSSSVTPSFGQSISAVPSFSQPAASLTPSFNAPAATTAPGFAGFSQPTATPASSGGMFSFGQKAPTPQAPVTTNSSFSFGGSAPAVTSPTSAFSFGQQQPATTTASGSIFGRLGDKQAEAKPAFSFGGNNQQQSSAPSMFGGITNNTTAAQSAPMFGSSMGTSAFGQTNNSNQPAANANMFGCNQAIAPSNDFGSMSKPASGGMFSFGGATNNNNNNNTQAAAAQSPSNGMFSFGSNSNTPNNAQPSSANVFGGGNSNSGQNVSASFTFKPSTGTVSSNPNPNVFGQSQPAAAPPSYQFNGQTANASFSFGGATATPQASSQPSAFNFSGPQSAPAAGAFNFQGVQPSLAPQPTAGGLFNIGTAGNQQQQRRPIRQAMRRMK